MNLRPYMADAQVRLSIVYALRRNVSNGWSVRVRAGEQSYMYIKHQPPADSRGGLDVFKQVCLLISRDL